MHMCLYLSYEAGVEYETPLVDQEGDVRDGCNRAGDSFVREACLDD